MQVVQVLQVVQRVIARHLRDDAGLGADEGQGGAVTLNSDWTATAGLSYDPSIDQAPAP